MNQWLKYKYAYLNLLNATKIEIIPGFIASTTDSSDDVKAGKYKVVVFFQNSKPSQVVLKEFDEKDDAEIFAEKIIENYLGGVFRSEDLYF